MVSPVIIGTESVSFTSSAHHEPTMPAWLPSRWSVKHILNIYCVCIYCVSFWLHHAPMQGGLSALAEEADKTR